MNLKDALFVALIALQVLDCMSTVLVLGKGGKELNPIMARLMDAMGVVPAMVAIKLLLIGFVWHYYAAVSIQDLAVVCVIYAAVLAHNLLAYLRLR